MAEQYEEEIDQSIEKLYKVSLNIAITGESGSGKSTLVNALRGIKNRTKGAAPTGMEKTTMKPTEYVHPENEEIKIWDLPGIGTTNLTADRYSEEMGFKKYDFFIIVSSDRFRENDGKLAKEIQRLDKKLYFVRSKIDNSINDERNTPNFSEEKLLKLIRDNCTEELKKMGTESPEVFLVSSVRLSQYEIKDLWKIVDDELETIRTNQLAVEIKTALHNNDQALATKMVQAYLKRLKKVPLTIAITGESGSGKSTLVNALRGIKNNTKGAAPTGAVETTMKPTEYVHPKNNKIKIWDLPGIGTTNFTADKYLEHVGFKKYNFFIIVSSDRFRENDAKLAKEIQKMKKKFYFVRSKIDNSINGERNTPNFNEENLLKLIRDNCTKELQKLGLESPKVFLVCGVELNLYEFKDLWKTLQEELPKLKRDALLLALPNISQEVIEQKKKILENRIKWYTVASVAGAVVPIPGVSVGVNLSVITAFVEDCLISLGLTAESLLNQSAVSGVSLEDLKAELESPLSSHQTTTDLVLKVLTESSSSITAKAIHTARCIPILGMVPSGFTTHKVLNYILNSLAEDAQRVFKKALGLNTSV